jgi:hypothetical protein
VVATRLVLSAVGAEEMRLVVFSVIGITYLRAISATRRRGGGVV